MPKKPCKDCLLKSLGIETFDLDFPSLTFNEGEMSATGVLATSTVRDRQGDILEVKGIDTHYHRLNPVVLLDHGLAYPLPIGHCEDGQGNYTVVVGENSVLQTTYFNQSDKVAEQVYRLVSEKRLRGNSIGWRPIEIKRLPPDPKQGLPAGKHILRCELLEATWTGLPANPECVTSILDSGRVGDQPLAPALKSLLLPYRLPRKAWANGGNMEHKDYEPMSSVDESRGGALREEPEMKDDLPEDEEMKSHFDESAESEEGEKEPLGASVLRDFHSDLLDVAASYEEVLPQLEQPKVKSRLEKLVEDLKDAALDVQEVFAAVYPDAEGLEGAVEEAPEEEGDVDEAAESEESADDLEDVDEPDEAFEGKCYMRAKELLKLAIKEMEMEADGESHEENEMHETKDEELSEDERMELKRLERSIARREKMLSRFAG